MSTLDDVLALQNSGNVLQAPVVKSAPVHPTPGDSATLTISLYNSTSSSNVFAYITGLAINDNYAVMLIEADGSSVYYPSNPSSNGSPLTTNCSIPLGAPGTTVQATIPYIAGGRIWFCVDQTLTFLLNPSSTGAQLVEPSVTNTSDPNYHKTWDFCEFTYNSSQIYANISYVDFVCLPIALTLSSSDGPTQHVSGMPANGLATVCNGLIDQNNQDGAGWDQLIINDNGSTLRALSPTNGIVFNGSLFSGYWDSYVQSVYNYYESNILTVETQSQWGEVTGQSNGSSLNFAAGSFTMPNAAAIFSGASGAFAAQANNTAELLNIGARLDAAFNRSTLLIDTNQPEGEQISTYYQNSITNHYARIVHAANLDGFGYAFPYDDVAPTNGTNVSGFVADGNPTDLLVTVGGRNAYASKKRRKVRSISETAPAPKFAKRSISWREDVKEQPVLSEVDLYRDLEKGQLKLTGELPQAEVAPRITLPAPLERLFGRYLTRFYESPDYNTHIEPLLALLRQVFASLVSLSVRAIISRVFILLLIVLLYFFDIAPRGTELGSELESQKRVLEAAGLLGVNSTLLSP